jgi:hypothetical protein
MADRKQQFIAEQALISSIGAAVKLRQRDFYKKAKDLNISTTDFDKSKKEFRNGFASLLIQAAKFLKTTPVKDPEVKLLIQIEWIQFELEKIKGDLLVSGQPTFGVVQKAFNLTLKYLWCFGMIEKPPHCPVDGQVLKKVGWNGVFWPLMTKQDYLDAITKVKYVAGSSNLCDWEMSVWRPSIKIDEW